MLEQFFMRNWTRRGLVAYFLWPLSWLYGCALNFRFGLYLMGYRPQKRLPVPVIVVGNIFVGGTGKTPLVIWLVNFLRLHGWNPGVISRGYGVNLESIREVKTDSEASEVGDEPLLIAQNTDCPLMVGRQRGAVAERLLALHPSVDLIISDDGLQHYALARDVEIVMFDQRGIGNGFLLPAGPLRETARRHRDFTVLNVQSSSESEAPKGIGAPLVTMQLMPCLCIRLTNPMQKIALRSMEGKKILAAAGIGNPQRFFQMLAAYGLVFEEMPLPDHFSYTSELFEQKDAEIILITEKDAVKCRQLAGLKNDQRIWVVPVTAQLDSQFGPQLLDKLSEKKHGLAST